MLIYNTTYAVEKQELASFINWVREIMIPAVHAEGTLHSGRLTHILDNRSESESISLSLQFCVKDSAALHGWYLSQGRELQKQMKKVFGDRVMDFPTLMEVIE